MTKTRALIKIRYFILKYIWCDFILFATVIDQKFVLKSRFLKLSLTRFLTSTFYILFHSTVCFPWVFDLGNFHCCVFHILLQLEQYLNLYFGSLSGKKGMPLDSILRSSRRYKNAKLMASQLEESESQPLDFVPESQAGT